MLPWCLVSRVRTKGILVLKFILKPFSFLIAIVQVEEAKIKPLLPRTFKGFKGVG